MPLWVLPLKSTANAASPARTRKGTDGDSTIVMVMSSINLLSASPNPDAGVPHSCRPCALEGAAGEIDAAAHMLGRAFAMRGTIVHGERRGRGLGWPTINLMPDKDQVIPDRGVYVASVRLGGESRARPAVTNVGVRPTVSAGKDLLVESHILDFSADVYGMEAEVAFLRRLRAERAFESVEALSTQIKHDVEQARQYFASAQQDRSSERTEETFDGK